MLYKVISNCMKLSVASFWQHDCEMAQYFERLSLSDIYYRKCFLGKTGIFLFGFLFFWKFILNPEKIICSK